MHMPTKNEEPRRPDIAHDLVERANASRLFRERLTRGLLSHPEQQWGIHQERANAGVLRRLFGQHEWPGLSLVGEDGAEAAWRLALHADHEPGLQRMALLLLAKAVEQGEAPIQHWAHLHDRTQVSAGQPQQYGTQHRLAPGGEVTLLLVHDPASLDNRRNSVGLPPAAVAHEGLRRRYARTQHDDPADADPPHGHAPGARAELVGSSA
jgi:hypothetical protein